MQRVERIKNWRKFVPSLLAIALGIYLCALFVTGVNRYYINSNYFNFNFLMGLLLLICGVASLFLVRKADKNNYLPLIFLLAVAILIPAAPLSSATASARTLNVAGGVANEQEVSPLFQRDPKQLRISDWVKLQNFEADYSRFVGKKVDVVGFLFKSKNQHVFAEDNFIVGRFVVTCCAVDASPLGLEILREAADGKDLFTGFKVDDWVRVEGEWKLASKNDEQYLVVVPTNISRVERPANPYE